ncbi:MAG: hypothetical protein J6L69_06790 [Lachnospiraceae bacterium]|nr:hypothetical protein [Lachnospiraceae bacterium]
MNKIVKNIIALMMVLVVVSTMSQSVSAETFYWSATKTPGMTSDYDTVKIALYKGTMTFKVTDLNGSCSYLVGQCESLHSNLYYINNTAKNVKISVENGTQTFIMAFSSAGEKEDYMYLKCSVEHNASVGQLAAAAGIIYF